MADFPTARLQINPRRILFYTLLSIGALILMHLLSVYYMQLGREGFLNHFLLKFNLDEENSVPAYFSALLLMFVSLVCGSIALQAKKGKMGLYWGGLAFLFLLLSFDEASSFHELLIMPLREAYGFDGWLYFAWILPGVLFALLFGISYLHFLLQLPRRIALLFVVAGFLYVGGAVGVEALGGKYAALYQSYTDWNYMLLVLVEEALEMFGISLFIYALLCYKQQFQRKLKIVIG